MAKLTAWLVTIIGLLLIPPIMNYVKGVASSFDLFGWLIAILVIVIGAGKLMRNYKK